MDANEILGVLAAFGAGGILTNFVKDSAERRRMRADLLRAQRDLTNVPYDDPDAFGDATSEVTLQAMIAGAPQWVTRHYGGICGVEGHERQKELGLIDLPEDEEDDPELLQAIPRVVVAMLYKDAEEMFNYAIWHPVRARFLWPFWKRRTRKFFKSIGYGAYFR